MALSLLMSKSISDVIDQFVAKIAEKYELDANDIRKLWDSKSVTMSCPLEEKDNKSKVVTKLKSAKVKAVNTDDDNNKDGDFDENVLAKCLKPELVAFCKKHGHRAVGTKADLINRLLGREETAKDEPKVAKASKSSAKVTAKDQAKVESKDVVKMLTANVPKIVIKKNKYDNMEHASSGLVFNKNKQVIGRQNEDGSIDDLTPDDIDQCNAFKFEYVLPVDLDKKSGLSDVKVQELDDEDLSDDDIIEEALIASDGDTTENDSDEEIICDE